MTGSVSGFRYRADETPMGMFDRSGRFFCRNGSWFFRTREEIDCGPYKSRRECRDAYNEFIFLVSEKLALTPDGEKVDLDDTGWNPPDIKFY